MSHKKDQDLARGRIRTQVHGSPTAAVNQASVRTVPIASWQPIETAPKNTALLLWWPHWSQFEPIVGWWQINGGWQSGELPLEGDNTPPTHWMPLPEPPL